MRLFIAISGIYFCSLSVTASEIQAYVCDTCGEQGAQVLAASYAPLEQCHFTNPPGTSASPDDRVCSALAKELIVVNPVNEQAFKYRVQLQCYVSWCGNDVSITPLNLTNDEHHILATYYEIDASMRNAIGQMNSMLAMSLRGDFSTFSTSSSVQQCSENPMDYFTNPTTRERINNEVRERVKQKVGNKSWSQYITTNYIGPNSFTIGRQTANVSFDRTNVSYPAYERYFLGGTPEERNRNNLNFRVDYMGRVSDQPGVSTWGLRLSVDQSTSWVDGYELGNLTPGGGTVNFGDALAGMPCFNEYVQNQEVTITPIAPGGGSVGGPVSPGDGGGAGIGGGDCLASVTATVCSTTSDGQQSCSSTVYHFRTVC